MKTKTAKYFEVKIQYQKLQEDGKFKKTTEQYVVDALSFTEAENHIIEEMSVYIASPFEVVAEKIAPYNEIFLSDSNMDDKWFIAKVAFITLDEKSGKEKKQTTKYLVQAATSECALEYTKEAFAKSMADYEIAAIIDTPTLDVFFHEESGGVKQPTDTNEADDF